MNMLTMIVWMMVLVPMVLLMWEQLMVSTLVPQMKEMWLFMMGKKIVVGPVVVDVDVVASVLGIWMVVMVVLAK